MAFVVLPRNAEHEYAFRFYDSFEDLGIAILWVTLEDNTEGFCNFLNGLVEFWFCGVFGFYFSHDF